MTFHVKEGPFIPVLRLTDVLLKPTNTDGDAISVREALYLGVPVVASDVVERPYLWPSSFDFQPC